LEQPALGNAPQDIKDKSLKVVMDAVLAVKTSDLGNAVKALDNDELDLLLKYIYRGMSLPDQYTSSNLLMWHEKVVEAAGLGSIVRVLTDRKSV
jgi:actin related protein 2/3 complex subunit 5